MRQPPGKVVHLGTGIATAYSEHGFPGVGPPVVLLHAWGESRRVFVRLLSYLPGHVYALAPDLRGHGDANKPATGYDVITVAEDVVAFLDAREIESAVLMGASSGGYVAQQVAVAHPTRVAGLFLTGAPRSLHGRVAPFHDQVAALRDPLEPGQIRRFALTFVRRGRIPDWYLDVLVDDGLRIPADIWRASLDGLGISPAPTDVGTIEAPAVVVVGSLDTFAGRAEGDALVQAIRGARLVEYDDTGHVVHWEQPERLARDIASFVDELAARSAAPGPDAAAQQGPPDGAAGSPDDAATGRGEQFSDQGQQFSDQGQEFSDQGQEFSGQGEEPAAPAHLLTAPPGTWQRGAPAPAGQRPVRPGGAQPTGGEGAQRT